MTIQKSPQQCSEQNVFVKRVSIVLALAMLCSFNMAFFVSGPIQKNAFMGAEYCGACHQEQYESWYRSPHANAFSILPAESRNDKNCLACHATGVFDDSTHALPGVQCEACHGPGQYHVDVHSKKDHVLSKALFMQTPDAKSCLDCHSQLTQLGSSYHSKTSTPQWFSERGANFHGMTIKPAPHSEPANQSGGTN